MLNNAIRTGTYSKEYTPTQNFWVNVFGEWPDKEKDIDPNDIPKLYESMSSLNEREVEAIKMRCGLDRSPMTYKEIGNHFGVGKERMRQILMHAFRKLRNPIMAGNQIKFLFATRDELKAQIIEQQELIKLLSGSNLKLSMAINTQARAIEEEPSVIKVALYPGAITIEELDFSVRTYNCLRRSGKHTLSDLIKLSSRDLSRIRNLGYKGVKEIEQKLTQYGLVLDEE